MASEFPKTFYRYNEAGDKEGRTFNDEANVEKGWLTYEDFAALPVPAKKAAPAAGADPVAAGKRLAAAERDNAALKDSVKLLEDNAALDAAKLEAAKARATELEAFVQLVAADPKCPADLKDAIAGLFAPAEAAQPKPKRTKA